MAFGIKTLQKGGAILAGAVMKAPELIGKLVHHIMHNPKEVLQVVNEIAANPVKTLQQALVVCEA